MMAFENTKSQFEVNEKTYHYYRVRALADKAQITRLPYTIRILLESLLRHYDGYEIKKEHINHLLNWGRTASRNVPFKPSRVILQDLTGVPAVVDLASLRKAMVDMGEDPEKINPEIPVDLVIDHSVSVDTYGNSTAFRRNMEFEFERNAERYAFLHWAQQAFNNFRVIPPATGIVHQVNLEYIATVVNKERLGDGSYNAYPDTLVGTDSHTPMINGLGVLGWGVGGIEAEACMLGQASHFTAPEVIGVKLNGDLPEGTTATDLALQVTQLLREQNVVGKFVEFFGEGLKNMPLADRATISNMAPEYGATVAFFPVDEEVLNYLRLTGRSEEHIAFVKKYCQKNDLWYAEDKQVPDYTQIIEINLQEIVPNVAGPKRPQDLTPLSDMKEVFRKAITTPLGNHGYGLSETEFQKQAPINHENGTTSTLTTGDIVIAAITSCTNTSNPHVMLAAGLLAKKAVEKGLYVPKYVKTSFAPGSKVVTNYLETAGLMPYLDQLGFHLIGYGCTTCMGNSGPLNQEVEEAIIRQDLLVASVLSGNRNFEGRIHPLTKANYLVSPPLVVAYAIAGTMNINLLEDKLGKDRDGKPVYLKDIWPLNDEITEQIQKVVTPDVFRKEYENIFSANQKWNEIQSTKEAVYQWEPNSTYIQNPTFFKKTEMKPFANMRVLAYLGDTVTTDHISPAGTIPIDSPAGKYLLEKGVVPREFNSYGSRRGNHEVMIRGTFANIRLRNKISGGKEGGYTTYWPNEEVLPIYDAAKKYKESGTGLIILGGKDYGMGSSRDWAAKGTRLLGVKIVIAESFERIHRSNLVMMGVLPLEFTNRENAESLGITGKEYFSVALDEKLSPNQKVNVTADKIEFEAIVRLDDQVEIDYFYQGGILQKILYEKRQEDLNVR